VSLPLARPSLRRQDFDLVLDAMVHDRLASGEVTRGLGREIARSLTLKEVYLLASVGDAVRRVVKGLGLAAGDRVVLSPLAPTYWPEVLTQQGLVPLFADVGETSPVLDPEAVVRVLNQNPKAIVADSCLGFLPDVAALAAHGLPVIEDISQGLGGSFEGQAPGTLGAAVVAQFAPETLVAGAGGALAGFRNPPDAAMGELPSWEALSDLGASLILSQWKDREIFAEKKREHFRHLFHRLSKVYRQPRQMGDAEPVLPWFPVLVDSGAKEVLAYSRKKAVEADWAFRNQPYLNVDSAVDFCPHARSFLFHTLIFPLYATISLKELELLGKVISSLP
jgi:dTDP-4-amino-4,6-dideoxygalactose transaminase